MVTYQQWVEIATELAADGVPPQRVFSRAGEVWNRNKQRLMTASKAEARRIGRQTL